MRFDDTVQTEIVAAWDAHRTAMERADADALSEFLTDDFVLEHMTGYRQSKSEWLDEVRRGSMRYHSITTVSSSIEESAESTFLVVRTKTDATIWGTRAIWRLRLRIRFIYRDEGWVAAASTASTW